MAGKNKGKVSKEQAENEKKNLIIVLSVIIALSFIFLLCVFIPKLIDKINEPEVTSAPATTSAPKTNETSATTSLYDSDYVPNIVYEKDNGKFGYDILNDGTIALRDYLLDDKVIVIPSEIDGKKVTLLSEDMFYGNRTVEKMYIPSSIKTIEDRAFAWVYELGTICFEGSEEEWNSIKIGTTGIGIILGADKEFNCEIPE